MKLYKIIFTIVLAVLFCSITIAQPREKRDREERIESMRIAFITDRLELSPTESQQFWPLYNELQDKKRALKDKADRPDSIENITDAEADKLILEKFDRDQKELDLDKAYYIKIKEVISSKRLIKLLVAEREFKKRLLERMNGHRDGYGHRRN